MRIGVNRRRSVRAKRTPQQLRALLNMATARPWYADDEDETIRAVDDPEMGCPPSQRRANNAAMVAAVNHADALVDLWEAAKAHDTHFIQGGGCRLCTALARLEEP